VSGLSPGDQIKLLRDALTSIGCKYAGVECDEYGGDGARCRRCEALAETKERDGYVFAYRVEIGGQILMPDDATWVTVEWIRDQGGGQRQIAHVEGGLSNVEAGALLRYRPPVEDDHARR